jgi:hypothetical protein
MAKAKFAQVSLGSPQVLSYITNRSPKPPTCSLISRDKNHCSLVVMSGGGVSYLIRATKLMQNWG